jgi:hypothetical protein
VTLRGIGFAGATAVTFGSTPAATFRVLDARTISAVTPPQGVGTVTVTVTTPVGVGNGLVFTYVESLDSQRLRSTQILLTRMSAQTSGAAVGGAVGSAISEGFADDAGDLLSQSGDGLRINFNAEPRSRVNDAFAALASADKRPRLAKDWRFWAEIRGTGWSSRPLLGDVQGGQVNALIGITRKVSDNVVIGLLGGYETLDFTTKLLDGRLRGGGWTFGGYFGWRVLPGLRLDGSISRAGINYDVSSGAARWPSSVRKWRPLAPRPTPRSFPAGTDLINLAGVRSRYAMRSGASRVWPCRSPSSSAASCPRASSINSFARSEAILACFTLRIVEPLLRNHGVWRWRRS